MRYHVKLTFEVWNWYLEIKCYSKNICCTKTLIWKQDTGADITVGKTALHILRIVELRNESNATILFKINLSFGIKREMLCQWNIIRIILRKRATADFYYRSFFHGHQNLLASFSCLHAICIKKTGKSDASLSFAFFKYLIQWRSLSLPDITSTTIKIDMLQYFIEEIRTVVIV